MRATLLFVLLPLLAAGCAVPGASVDDAPPGELPFDALATSAAETTKGADGTLTHTFRGGPPVGAGARVASHHVAGDALGTFEVDGRVGFVALASEYESALGGLAVVLLDPEDRILCAALPGGGASACTVGVPPGAARTWTVALR